MSVTFRFSLVAMVHLARERSKGESRSTCLPLSLPSSRLCDRLASRGVGATDMLPLPCLHQHARHSRSPLRSTWEVLLLSPATLL